MLGRPGARQRHRCPLWRRRPLFPRIQRIDPPPDVIAAMHHQMKAERTRRAVVTEAQGAREASITRAEGEKQSAILTSEGLKQGQILQAQGEAEATRAIADAERFRKLTEAEGEAAAIKSVYGAIHDGRPTADVLAVKYLEALQVMADGQATKIFLPVEASALLGALGGLGQALDWNGTGAPPVSGDGLGGNGPSHRINKRNRSAVERRQRYHRASDETKHHRRTTSN